MYADDLIIMATSPEELQKSLDGLNKYCTKWKLNVNVKKSKCKIFSKGSNVKKHQFKINNKLAEITNEYKNIGNHSITWSPKNISSGLYFIKISQNEFSEKLKLMYIK